MTGAVPVHDRVLVALLALGVGIVAVATIVGMLIRRLVLRRRGEVPQPLAESIERIHSWWGMLLIAVLAVGLGETATIVTTALVSFLALREFVTLTPTERGDHRALFWGFFVILPGQYILIGMHRPDLWFVMVPVFANGFAALRVALAGQADRFMERVATVQWGLVTCVYCLSYLPALLSIDIGHGRHPARLVIMLLLIVETGDVAASVVGKLVGRHRLSAAMLPNRTWEGMSAGFIVAVSIAILIASAVPIPVWKVALVGAATSAAGLAGSIVMSTVKRARGATHYGSMIGGYGGVLDRVDSLIFAAPMFYHAMRIAL